MSNKLARIKNHREWFSASLSMSHYSDFMITIDGLQGSMDSFLYCVILMICRGLFEFNGKNLSGFLVFLFLSFKNSIVEDQIEQNRWSEHMRSQRLYFKGIGILISSWFPSKIARKWSWKSRNSRQHPIRDHTKPVVMKEGRNSCLIIVDLSIGSLEVSFFIQWIFEFTENKR